MLTAEIQAQNLRNKYENHTVIKPLISYCSENKLGFEFLMEIVQAHYGLKSFNTTCVYYMKIGNILLKQDSEYCGWQNLLDLITFAYEYLGIKKPETLIKALNSFNR